MPDPSHDVTRRDFMRSTAVVAGAAVVPGLAAAPVQARGTYRFKVGLVGCGGRGTGAAVNILDAGEDVQIWALADLFPDRLRSCRDHLSPKGERGAVPDRRCFTGFDAYRELLEEDLDIVILATPPQFRPPHFAAAVEKGVHVFMEKPVAVDPTGIRTVLESGALAERKRLSVVAGTQRRHEKSYLEAIGRLKAGAIGPILAASCYWNQGGLWVKEQRPEWSDMEWQVRNWLYFTWLSGDHIVEQHVHNLDVCNWAIGSHPTRAMGMGGRQVRTGGEYGHIFDHFAIEYEYPGGVYVTSMCRQIEGCAGRVEERIRGADGVMTTRPGQAVITGRNPWRFTGQDPNPYVSEHEDLLASIRSERPLNEARTVAESTLTAIMGRMTAYTGKEVTWEQAMSSKLDLSPPAYEFGPLPVPPVAVPGRTPLV